MTALVPREVDRTFSEVRRFWTGLPGPETHEAGRQDFGDFGEAFGCGLWKPGRCHYCRRLNENLRMSSALSDMAKTDARHRNR
jgi:hypothetical protein